eukprot:gene1297-2509_t
MIVVATLCTFQLLTSADIVSEICAEQIVTLFSNSNNCSVRYLTEKIFSNSKLNEIGALIVGIGTENETPQQTLSINESAKAIYLDALLGSNRMIEACQPSILIEGVTAASSQALFNILEMYGYEHIYWHIEQYELEPLLGPQYQQSPLYRSWSPDCIDGTLSPCHQYCRHRIERIPGTDSGDVFLSTFIPEFNEESLSLIEGKNPSLSQLSFTIPFITSPSVIDHINKVHCYRWIRNLYQQLSNGEYRSGYKDKVITVDRNLEKNLEEITVEMAEINILFESCVTFASADFHFKREFKTQVAVHRDTVAVKAAEENEKEVDEAVVRQGLDTSFGSQPNSPSTPSPFTAHTRNPSGSDSMRRDSVFDPLLTPIFHMRNGSEHCYEPIYCNHAWELRRRIRSWQFPDDAGSFLSQKKSSFNRTCNNSKFLIYDPISESSGIGSMIIQIVSTFRFAICLGRIFVLDPTSIVSHLSRWKLPGCRGTTFECYFEKLHRCPISQDDVKSAPTAIFGENLDKFPLNEERFVRLEGLPVRGKCTLYGSQWEGNFDIFDGLVINPHEHISHFDYDIQSRHMLHFTSFLSSVKVVWMPVFIRYVINPKAWFADLIREVLKGNIIGPTNQPVYNIPHPFVSLHVRYGFKDCEVNRVPLYKYMNALKYKYPSMRNVFLSTETDAVIDQLRLNYPDFNFYHIEYPRIEYLSLSGEVVTYQNYTSEFIYSLANLHVSVEADAFIGTLTSNWCILIHHLERTRGDGGYEYFSLDGGSAFNENLKTFQFSATKSVLNIDVAVIVLPNNIFLRSKSSTPLRTSL